MRTFIIRAPFGTNGMNSEISHVHNCDIMYTLERGRHSLVFHQNLASLTQLTATTSAASYYQSMETGRFCGKVLVRWLRRRGRSISG